MADTMAGVMFLFTMAVLMSGYPVAFALGGSALAFAGFGFLLGVFDLSFFSAFPERVYGVMVNQSLVAVPLFIFMGVMLERSKISEDLLETLGLLFGKTKGGIGVSICLVGALLAASTGIVGATVVTMGLISLPVMLRYKYSPSFASGIIAASGTLGQIIPPSIILVLLGDVIGSAHQQAQLSLGNFSPSAVSVGDLFLGALFPGLLLVALYIVFVFIVAQLKPDLAPAVPAQELEALAIGELRGKVFKVLLPPVFLIIAVLGSILAGVATPTEAASFGSVGALLMAWVKGQLSLKTLQEVMESVAEVNCMVFTILLGSSLFSLVFRGFGGDEVVGRFLTNLPGGVAAAFVLVMAVMFLLGFFLDFFEITFVMVPIVGPILLAQGLNPIWLGVMIAINLQTSFLTPPFGFALFYLRGVAPKEVTTLHIYKGVIPFILIQILVLGILWMLPQLILWLPTQVYGS
ncbi:MAG: C4-dicarboxylate ABC transporter [Candidatus Lambdaproteobacteria bacterium RIFOXYD1_FULL_56_27]|uniref:TRAP transporter large permease protein n=1 Tax=Candidatus Lambdaproteobacteria bacterium RIFOXYD2_FULL_56_26 TaxID=1817773 RepID=A0A1F6GL68_9PROT|nr:MAG: C4-dicarboxylate ABC transporter [Candidatus Lambdaproteobacteria bacterium RIFOXYD2_FULL_56_26]OGH03578.1 MAG: C4-dicarboxylate ABC transporter [Candidatus Lambdaproteobacteria bacterium RIFOXYC1_FULL_56_13]OGH08715.1 MAG: C4-dicarboxylate ABC transporter [Candidatus Lambdaproteobacteria bacterium RIFOXYD1_FULL_56_27]